MHPPPTRRDRARALRRSATDAEHKLWSHLRSRKLMGVKFRRQVCIGPYLADFCSLDRRLVIELDGGQHAKEPAREAARTQFLKARGFRVIRFWNNEVLVDIDSVLRRISDFL